MSSNFNIKQLSCTGAPRFLQTKSDGNVTEGNVGSTGLGLLRPREDLAQAPYNRSVIQWEVSL